MTTNHHFQLQGVRCNGCVAKIRTALQAADSGADIDVELTHQHATITTELDSARVAELLEQLGYAPHALSMTTHRLETEDVRCNGCLNKIRTAIEARDEDATAEADFERNRLTVSAHMGVDALCELIASVGYQARPLEPLAPTTFAIPVTGVRCNGCVNKIRNALLTLDEGLILEADLDQQLLTFTSSLPPADVHRQLEDLGYAVQSEQVNQDAAPNASSPLDHKPGAEPSASEHATGPLLQFSLTGMTCAACVASVEKALINVPDVTNVSINFANRTALVEGSSPPQVLVDAVAAAGYGAQLIEDPEQAEQQRAAAEKNELSQRLMGCALGLGLGIPMMGYGMVYGMALDSGGARFGWGVVGLLTLAMMWLAGGHMYRGAWLLLKRGSANMDTLIALGTGSAWLYSMVAVLAPDWIPAAARGLYFEAAAMIIGLVNLGQALELRARGRTQAAVRSLLDLRPKTACVVRDGIDVSLPVAEVQVGDLIRIRPGEHVPVDAVVVEGNSQVDESMLTGEPQAVAKQVADAVSAGTLNRQGSLLVRAERVGRDTALARIIDLVRKAQNSKPPISRLADRVASIFVPVVVVIAIVTAAIWYLVGPEPRITYMLVTAVTVLIIACPCALGLATPISIMIGVGKAAEQGILIRSGDALQQASGITTVVLDKTGTVTEGRPQVTDAHYVDAERKPAVLSYLRAVEQRSEHPLAEALVNYADAPADATDVSEFEALSGQGVVAVVDGVRVQIGNHHLMGLLNIDIDAVLDTADGWQQQAKTVVYMAVDGQLQALFAVADPLRDDAVDAIARLQRDGLRVVMLSGDNNTTVQAVAKALGLDQAHGQLQPADKLAMIEALQASGERVAMVGDGINDAPALSQADVGFAIGTGTDVAIESADVALMQPSLHRVADAIELSRATLTNIRQNLWGAFIYNGLGIPVAAGVLYPLTGMLLNPVVAGVAMSLSSVTVVTNANRLRLVKVGRQRQEARDTVRYRG